MRLGAGGGGLRGKAWGVGGVGWPLIERRGGGGVPLPAFAKAAKVVAVHRERSPVNLSVENKRVFFGRQMRTAWAEFGGGVCRGGRLRRRGA